MEHLLTPKDFFYPRVAMDFYQSMTTNQVRDPTLIHFTIDGRHGILGARHIDYRVWTNPPQLEMVHILSRGTSTNPYLLRKELPPSMFFIDALLRHNIYPLQHWVQRRGVLLEALFVISRDISLALTIRLWVSLSDAIPLLFPRLLCQILEHLGYPSDPQLERKRICREVFTLDKWTNMTTYRAEHPELPQPQQSEDPKPAEIPAARRASIEPIHEGIPLLILPPTDPSAYSSCIRAFYFSRA
ncbi:hypothetical protein AAG906_018656 [Vitis piasezkii]